MRHATHRATALQTAIAASLLLSGCGDDSSGINPEELNDLTDTWLATKIEYASTETATRVNLITQGGQGTLVLNDDQSFTLETSAPAGPNMSLAGAWQFNDDLFQLLPTGAETMSFHATLSQDELWLSGAETAYDFDEDLDLDPAVLNLEFERAAP